MKHIQVFESWSPAQKIEEVNTTASLKYHEGFQGKWACIQKSGFAAYDVDQDGVIELFMSGEKSYFPFGKSATLDPKTHKFVDTKWSCDGGKVIDAWRKNDPFKTYKKDTVWQKTQLGVEYLPHNVTDKGSDGTIVKDIQQKLIDLGFLAIPHTTGNYGAMTQRAIVDFAHQYDPSQETNQVQGITRDVYELLMKATDKKK